MTREESIKLFFQYLNTAEVVYKDGVCQTDMNSFKHRYDFLIDDVIDACANPNKTFSVTFNNGEKSRFKFYVMKPHYYKTDDVDIEYIVRDNFDRKE